MKATEPEESSLRGNPDCPAPGLWTHSLPSIRNRDGCRWEAPKPLLTFCVTLPSVCLFTVWQPFSVLSQLHSKNACRAVICNRWLDDPVTWPPPPELSKTSSEIFHQLFLQLLKEKSAVTFVSVVGWVNIPLLYFADRSWEQFEKTYLKLLHE